MSSPSHPSRRAGDTEPSMAYVAYCADCDGLIAATVDKPEYRRGKDETARFVADQIREGNRIERVTWQFVRENLNGCTATCGCKWCVKDRAKKQPKSQTALTAIGDTDDA